MSERQTCQVIRADRKMIRWVTAAGRCEATAAVA